MPTKPERVTYPDDPRRCQGGTTRGQCQNVAVEGHDLCESCAKRQDLVEDNRRQYLLTNPRFQARLSQLSEGDDIKLLRQEIAMARMLIEERVNRFDPDEGDFSAVCSSVNTLLITAEKLTSRSHILEQNLGQLFHKSTLVKLVQSFIQIVDDEVRPLPGGVEAIDNIVRNVFGRVEEARNDEKARSVKLLEAK